MNNFDIQDKLVDKLIKNIVKNRVLFDTSWYGAGASEQNAREIQDMWRHISARRFPLVQVFISTVAAGDDMSAAHLHRMWKRLRAEHYKLLYMAAMRAGVKDNRLYDPRLENMIGDYLRTRA